MACLITARLLIQVKDELSINTNIKLFAWSDSNVCLHWISGKQKAYKPFVENRVTEIRRLLNISCWRHISGKSNPADFGTKEFAVTRWIDNALWWHGPAEMSSSHESFCLDIDDHDIQNANVEAKCDAIQLVTTICEPTIDVYRFSNYARPLRTVCYVYKFYHRLKTPQIPNELTFTAEQFLHARNCLIIMSQKQQF